MVGSSLEKLLLVDLPCLENIPCLIDRLSKSHRLTELRIDGVPNLTTTSYIETWAFRDMQKLAMDFRTGDGSSSMETVEGILQGCGPSLDEITLKGTWKCLPESIQYLDTLSSLEIHDLGVEELPEWLGNLVYLKRLYIYNCSKLRCLPSMAAMSRLTALMYLTIDGCTGLRIQRDSEDDPEWSKISHLYLVRIY